jgi:RimJ/RimL family protein N-acetyltransferase
VWSRCGLATYPVDETPANQHVGGSRHGIGRALHGACVEDLRRNGFDEARLWVLEANPAARSFYERLGWAWDGTTAPHDVGGQEHPVVRYRLAL